MKKILFLLPILLLLTFSPIIRPVWATNSDHKISQEVQHLTNIATKAAERQDTQLAVIQKSADTMIADRLTSLNTLLTKIQSDTRLSSDEKTALTANINTMIGNLTALKAKIDADTDATTARVDRKTIVTSYHVYVTFEPQARLLAIISNLQTTTTTLQNLVPELQSLSTTLKNEGKDTTAMDTAIADINAQLANINTLLTNDHTTLSSLALTNNTYQSTFVAVREDLAKVRADFTQIRNDITIIRNAIHGSTGQTSLQIHTIPSMTPQPTLVK